MDSDLIGEVVYDIPHVHLDGRGGAALRPGGFGQTRASGSFEAHHDEEPYGDQDTLHTAPPCTPMPHRSDPVHIQPQQRCHRAPERSANARRGARRRRAWLACGAFPFCRKGLFREFGRLYAMAFLTPNFWILPKNRTLRQESPHLLRHSVATTLVERSIPIAQWQKFLGHSKLVTPQLYAASSTEMMRESSPRALSRCARPARAAPAFRGGLPGHRSIVVKDVTCHGLVAVPGANIVA